MAEKTGINIKAVFAALCLMTSEAYAQDTAMETPKQTDNSINYIELPMVDTNATKAFYNKAFGWDFTDWGPDYVSFAGAGIDGGFNGADGAAPTAPGVLVVLYADDLEAALSRVKEAGGAIVKGIFEFPGGRRFHFRDPNGNELAIWSEN